MCKNRKNILIFTHYDWDHIGLALRIYSKAPNTCLWQHLPSSLQSSKRNFLEKIPLCKTILLPKIKTIYMSTFQRKNESHAFIISNKLLITGDSDKKIEKKWLFKNDLSSVALLLAGHHGSRSSMARELLLKMTSLKMIFVSCKKRRYGHPHKETLEKTRRIQRPLLTTEIFGSIAIEID